MISHKKDKSNKSKICMWLTEFRLGAVVPLVTGLGHDRAFLTEVAQRAYVSNDVISGAGGVWPTDADVPRVTG